MPTRSAFLTAAGSVGAALVAPRRPAAAARADAPFGRAYPPAALRGDLDFLWDALLAVGTAPFLTSIREDVEAGYRRVRASLGEPLDVASFWLRIAPVFAALNDGHVAIVPPFATAQNVRIPVRLAVDGQDVVVVESASRAVAPGSVLAALDEVPAAEFRRVALGVVGAQTEALHRARVLAFSRVVAHALLGARPEYSLAWVSPGGEPHREPVPAGHLSAPGDDAGSPYAFRVAADGKLGLIDYRACVDRPRFARFLEATFALLRDRRVPALAIDLRENTGGDDRLNLDLWSYVATRPFKQVGATVARASDRLKREYGRERYVAEFGTAAWDAPAGTLVRVDYPLFEPRPNPLRFAGRVYVLIGPRTFSSGLGCALAAKDYGLAALVGEPTGEPVEGSGEVYRCTTPATGLLATFPTKLFLSSTPRPDGEGVLPDIVVPTTRADLIAGRDPVLSRVLAEIAS